MRPTATESLRAIQSAVAERFTPELSSLFAIEASTAVTMLCESLAAEADLEVENLVTDNDRLRNILSSAREALASNANAATLVSQLDGVLQESGDGPLSISRLSEVNGRLSEALAQLLESIEDNGEDKSLTKIRSSAYRHLRRVAVRGWSYFDVSGFRQRIIEARAEVDRDSAEEAI
jgi:hypothetical protein